jgi:hypothetical protein
MRCVFRAPAEPPGGRAVLMEAELIRECRIGPSRFSSAFLVAAIAILLVRPAHGDTINSLVGVNFQPYIGTWSGNPLAPDR